MTIQLLLPWPPSVNRYWLARGNTRFISKAGIAFREAVERECEQMGIKPLEGRLAVHIALFPPDRRVRDIDNILKALLDACEHAGCYASDSQIDELHVIRQGVFKNGHCTILILRID